MKDQEITFEVEVIDEKNRKKQLYIPAERPITLYLNNKELLTVMTLGMNTKSLIIGYLRNQQLVSSLDDIQSIQIDWDVAAAAIKVKDSVSNADILTEKVTITSGCGQGTMFGNLTADIEKFKLDFGLKIKQSVLLTIIDEVRCFSSSYNGRDLVFYTTGRLTSEMVIKGAQMQIPILLSRSGVTQMGVEMARRVDMTLLGRCSGKHFYIFNGSQRLIFDAID